MKTTTRRKIAKIMAELFIEDCEKCKDKKECWKNPVIGVPNTVSGHVRDLLNIDVMIAYTVMELLVLIKEKIGEESERKD